MDAWLEILHSTRADTLTLARVGLPGFVFSA